MVSDHKSAFALISDLKDVTY